MTVNQYLAPGGFRPGAYDPNDPYGKKAQRTARNPYLTNMGNGGATPAFDPTFTGAGAPTGAGLPVGRVPNPNYSGGNTSPGGLGAGGQGWTNPGGQGTGPYGYGTTPGSGPGYWEQQTPVGSFVSATAGQGSPQQIAFQQWATAQGFNNPYIGATSQGVGYQDSVMPYARMVADQALAKNPYLDRTTDKAAGVGRNAYSGVDNPYLNQAINSASQDATKNFNQGVMPQFDRMAQQSGSFGNTGVMQMQGNAIGEFGRNLGNIANNARMQDYTQQQALDEARLNREQGLNVFNAGLGAQDLNRQTAGFLTGQGLGIQGLNSLVGAAQFDAGMGNNVNQFNAGLGAQDLARNAGLAGQQGMFNAGALNTAGMFNAGQGNNLSQFNAGQGNQLGENQANRNQGTNLFNAGAGNNMLENWRNRTEGGRQFDENLDYNIYRGNVGDARNSYRDQFDLFSMLSGLNNQGLNGATNVQNADMNTYGQFVNWLNQMAGQGGTQTQNLQGNPWLSGIGGALSGTQLWNGFTRP